MLLWEYCSAPFIGWLGRLWLLSICSRSHGSISGPVTQAIWPTDLVVLFIINENVYVLSLSSPVIKSCITGPRFLEPDLPSAAKNYKPVEKQFLTPGRHESSDYGTSSDHVARTTHCELGGTTVMHHTVEAVYGIGPGHSKFCLGFLSYLPLFLSSYLRPYTPLKKTNEKKMDQVHT